MIEHLRPSRITASPRPLLARPRLGRPRLGTPLLATPQLATPILAIALLPLGLAAQSNREQLQPSQIDLKEIDLLGDPAKRSHAMAQVLAAGPSAVPQLRQRLRALLEEREASPELTAGIVEALGRMPIAAQAALPDVRDTYFYGPRLASNLAIWSATELAVAIDPNRPANPAAERTRCDEVAAWLEREFHKETDNHRYWWAQTRLHLGVRPEPLDVVKLLERGGVHTSAAAHAASSLGKLDRSTRQSLQDALAKATLRPDVPWLRDRQCDEAGGELAIALHNNGERTPAVALGLLQHWQASHRSTGLSLLSETNGLRDEQRLSIIRCLWDGDRQVRDQAIACLQAMGAHSMVALRALRAHEVAPTTGRRSIIYRRGAERLLDDACNGTSKSCSELIRHADCILRHEVWSGAITACDQSASDRLAQIVIGCRGANDDTLQQLAELACRRSAFSVPNPLPLRTAFLASLDTRNLKAWQAASAALVTIGPKVIPVDTALRQMMIDSLLVAGLEPHIWHAFTIEATILAGKKASLQQLHEQLTDLDWYLALHAMVELMDRKAVAESNLATLRQHTRDDFDYLVISPSKRLKQASSRWARLWHVHSPHRVIRAVSALALASAGEQSWLASPAREALCAELSVAEADLNQFMATVCEQQSFARHAKVIVQRMKKKRRIW